MNKAKGNMYGFVTHTWNPIKGKCTHGCDYCYMRRFPQNEMRLDEKELKANLGKVNTIFVGSGTDMWAKSVPSEWLKAVLDKCYSHIFYNNIYFFQTKNPRRFLDFEIPKSSILCTTIETNREYIQMGSAPITHDRAFAMSEWELKPYRRMVTIEPIFDFDLPELFSYIKIIQPDQVNIGADSKGSGLPEPPKWKIEKLISELKKITKIHIKPNLNRLLI